MANSSISMTIPNLVGIKMYYIPPEIIDPEAAPVYQNWNANIIKDRVENRIQYDSSTNPNNVLLYSWNMEYQEGVNPPVNKNYFWIKNEGVNRMIVSWDSDFEYRELNAEWDYFSGDVVVSPGEKIEVRRDSLTTPSSISVENYGDFDGSERYSIGGNIMSLLYGEDFQDKYTISVISQFSQLFKQQNVVDASTLELPATSLSSGCYSYMFQDCSNLVYPPGELPATQLSTYCYQSLFENCASLVQTPDLPALDLSTGCYQQMFTGCSSLTTAPDLDATVLASQCYYGMFSGCSSLVDAPELNSTNLQSNCYAYMFSGCSSLVNPPDLPATVLKNYCYRYMFASCTSLVTAPDLPALDLVTGCYNYMFSGCSSLNHVKAMFVTSITFNNHTSYINRWLSDVAQTGVFIKNTAALWDWPGVVPSGWTIQTASS